MTMTQETQDDFEDEWEKTEAEKPAVDAEASAIVLAHEVAIEQAADEYVKAHSDLESEPK